MRLHDLVAGGYDSFDTGAAMADVAAICTHDRYQASAGINDAAGYVAARAEAAGLTEVTVHSFPADGTPRWWTYRAPRSWTPLGARLRVGGAPIVRYPRQPYTLAAYSAPTPPGGCAVRLRRWSDLDGEADLTGTLVVVDAAVAPGAVIDRLTAAGAAGLVIDALRGRAGRAPDQVGRFELPPGARIVAFSVDPAALDLCLAAADAAGGGTIEVDISPDAAPMPVVTALLPGTGGCAEEILLSAHLCHPRPSANDNASGVAALLGVARVLIDGDRQRGAGGGAGPGVRFLWGPEFTGTAAYLHDVVHAGRAPIPRYAINVDMAGEDLGRCGGPLVIERGPDDLPSPLPALTTRCAALVPPRSWSYSGAAPCDAWTWRCTPFAGGSDHALLAAAPTRAPAVSLGHWPDRTNHSSLDTVDAVDPAELRRTATVVASTVAALRGCADPQLGADVVAATAAWATGHVLAALPGHRPSRPHAPGGGLDGAVAGGAVLDAYADGEAHRLLRHRTAVALGAVRALGPTGVDGAAIDAAQTQISAVTAAVLAGYPAPAPDDDGGPALVPLWSGPANLRALAEAATDDDRAWLDAQIARDRGGTLARSLALLGGVDGHRDRRAAAWWAALSSELPVPVAFADRFFDVVSRAGWATTTPRER